MCDGKSWGKLLNVEEIESLYIRNCAQTYPLLSFVFQRIQRIMKSTFRKEGPVRDQRMIIEEFVDQKGSFLSA